MFKIKAGGMSDVDPSLPAIHCVEILVYPGFQLLDACGPAAAFEAADEIGSCRYSQRFVAASSGEIRSSAGLSVVAQAIDQRRHCSTLVVSGGGGVASAWGEPRLLDYIRGRTAESCRIASVCTGAFLLAAAGILDGRRATTHWSLTQKLRETYPRVEVEPDRIYTRSGKIWTSAGISAGIDLSLALIGEDHGEVLARRVAKELVVPFRRLGGQSQYSVLAEMQRFDGRFAELLHHVRADLTAEHNVESLASRSAMSPRNFARAFKIETGITPAKAIEKLRCEAARAMLDGGATVKNAARATGFVDTERMRRAFQRTFGAAPAVLRYNRADVEPINEARR